MIAKVSRIKQMAVRDWSRLFTTGVPHLFTALLFTQGMGLIRRICLARILSVPEIGQMTYVMQIVDLIAIIADLGICTAVLKYAAEPVDVKEKSRLYSSGLFWGTAVAVVVSLFYMLVALAISGHETGAIRIFMLMVVPYIPLSAMARIPLTYMQACKQIKRASAYTIITRLLSFTVIILATYFFKLWGFFVTVTAMPLSNLIILLLATRRHLVRPYFSKSLLKKLSTFGFVSMLANVAGFANVTITVVLLRNLTKSDELVGYYSIALVVMNSFRLIPNAILRVAFPYLSGLIYDHKRLRQRMFELSIKQSALMLGLFMAWYFIGKSIISIVFGAQYLRSFYPSVLLISAMIPFSMGAVSGYVLLILNKIYLNLTVATSQLVVNLICCVVFIPKYGIYGAAIAFLVSEICSRSLSLLISNHVTKNLSSE